MRIRLALSLIIFSSFVWANQFSANCRKAIGEPQHLNWPENTKKKYPALALSQPKKVKMQKEYLLVNNSEILPFVTQGNLSRPEKVKELIHLLNSKGTFEFPITEEGFLPAANNGEHHGGYGSFIWLRDIARVNYGVASLPELLKNSSLKLNRESQNLVKMDHAMLKLFSEKEQILRTAQNIMDPNLHKDRSFGYKNVIFVRLGLEPRKKGRRLSDGDIDVESRWGHKQNDALAMYAHALLDAIASGRISNREISLDAQSELIYLASYFQRIEYFKMEDVGAWEERMGVRTSSVGLVTSFLERFNQGWKQQNPDASPQEVAFFKQLKRIWDRGIVKDHFEKIVRSNSLEVYGTSQSPWAVLKKSIDDLPESIEKGYETLFKGLGISKTRDGKTVYGIMREVHEGENLRGIDAAILHVLLYPLKEFKLQDRIHVLNQIEINLMKESGVNRYKEDWFLYGGPNAIEFAGRLPLNPDMIARIENGKYVQTRRIDRDRIYDEYKRQTYSKNMQEILNETGSGLEAQWSFQDSMMAQIYLQIYRETFDKKYLSRAKLHLSRALSAITGFNQLSIEGESVKPFQTPEAWIPVKLVDGEQVFTAYFASPNSPLNWSTAELVTALNSYLKVIEKKD